MTCEIFSRNLHCFCVALTPQILCEEPWPEGVSKTTWRDAWEVDGSSESLCGIWCPETMPLDDVRVRQWRFDRIYTWRQFGFRRDKDFVAEPMSLRAGSSDEPMPLRAGSGEEPMPLRAGSRAEPMPLRAGSREEPMPLRAGSFTTIDVERGSFDVQFKRQDLDHAFASSTLLIEPLVLGPRDMQKEQLKILRPGLGSKIARKPGEKESCAQKQHGHTYCGKDYEKPRLLPGMGSILEDPRRKALFRLYTRRNCHHLNTHDPLKAMGLVANVDDQVVLTVQAAVNYLTKYMGKLGGGHSAQSRVSGLIDDIVCRMGDRDTMTVASLLSKLFIHSAVPEHICSLEAWHLLFDLPRAISSRYVSSLNVKEDQQAFKNLTQVEQAKEEESVVQKNKISIYVDRFNMKTEGRIPAQTLEQMSLFQFFSRVERRRNSLHVRSKPNIVKEKPYLRLDMRRREAGGMARMCLRLHRPFRRAAEDPVHLDDAAAVLQLHEFVESPTCPVWLKKRYAKHNRMPKKKPTQVEVDVPGVSLPAAEDKRVIEAEVAAPTISGVSLRTAENPRVVEAEVAAPTVSGVSLRAAEMSSPSASRSGLVINLSGPRDAWPEPPSDEEAPAAPPQKCVSDELLPDTTAHRQIIANQHGLLWGSVSGDSRYSIVDAIRHQRPPLKLVNVKGYLSAIKDGKLPSGKQVLPLVEQFVFLMLSIDLQPYQRRGAGVYKACLTKAKLKDLIEAFFQSRGSSVTSKEKRNVMMKPYAELWEFVKLETLKQCGLAVSSSPSHRVCFPGQPMNPQSALRDGAWRQQVFCLDPHCLWNMKNGKTQQREKQREFVTCKLQCTNRAWADRAKNNMK